MGTRARNTLAGVLKNLAKKCAETDNVAATILTVLHSKRIKTLDAFNDYVSEAYAENGWRAGAGRPKQGETYEPVPKLVRIYISDIRAGYRLELNVLRFKTMKSLRDAVADARRDLLGSGVEAEGADSEPELEGVFLRNPGQLTGSVFHDLTAIYRVLPDEERDSLERSVERLVKKYQAVALPKLAAPPEPKRLSA